VVAGRPSEGETVLGASWERVFLFLTACLASTVVLKVGQVQYLEMLYAVQIVVLLAAFSRSDWQVTLYKPIAALGLLYLAFLAVATGLAIWALRSDFYIAEGVSPLKYPGTISLIRAAELTVSLSAMIYLAHLFRRDDRKARFAMRVYFRVGVASAVYGLLTYPLARAHLVYLGTSADYRVRGFYNEGGPYGLYVMSALFVGFSLRQLRWERQIWMVLGIPLLFFAFVGSQSKAAMAALLAVGLIDLLLLRSTAQRLVVAGGVVATLLLVSQVADVAAGLRLYRQASLAYERASYQHKNDPNFIVGRVAGAFIVPRMVAEHPLAGVGWGNYGLVRNAPEYRGASAWVDISDEPALGLAGLAAELGLPLTGFLILCLILPAIYLFRRGVPLPLMNLALLQPIAHLFGAQLNLTYPWIVTAFALGIGLRSGRSIESASGKTLQTKLA